jgi:hypothetical protein
MMKAGGHLPEPVGPNGQHRGRTDGRIHRVAPADPVPEREHVGGVDAKLGHGLFVRRNGREMPGDGRSHTRLSNSSYLLLTASTIAARKASPCTLR